MKNVFSLSLTLLLCCAFQSCSKDDDQVQTTIAVTAVMINEGETYSMSVGETHTFLATVSPTNATDKSITWSSSAPSTLFINDQSGVAEALAEGRATITATAGEQSATIDVIVTAVAEETVDVESVTISPESVETLLPEEQVRLTATVTPDDATDKSVTWESLNEDVATIDQTGLVTAVAEGEATIRATAGEASDEIVITVEQPSTPVVTVPEGWTVNGNTATYGAVTSTGWGLTVNFENEVCTAAQFTTFTGSSRATDIDEVFPESVLDAFTISGRGTLATIDLLVVAGCKEFFENLSMAEMFAAFGDNTSAILDNWTTSFRITSLVVGNWEMPNINNLRECVSGGRDDGFSTMAVLVTYNELTGTVDSTTWMIAFETEEIATNFLTVVEKQNEVLFNRFADYIRKEQPRKPIFVIDVTDIFPASGQSAMEDVLSTTDVCRTLLNMAVNGK